MRKVKILEIELSEGLKREVKVYEIRPKDLIKSFEKGGSFNLMIENILPLCTNLKVDEILDLFPSDMELLWDSFKGVNATFFLTTGKMGLLKKKLTEIWAAIQEDLSQIAEKESNRLRTQLAVLSVADTHPQQVTDGASS